MDGLTVGRNVHYIAERGTHHAALVTRLVPGTYGVVDLVVFAPDGVSFKTNVHPDRDEDPKSKGTWHWIERA